MLMAGLDRLDQGITLFGPDLKLVFANSRLVELVGLPQALAEPGTHFETIVRHNAAHGEYGH
ncbi:MAG: PAS-domain containing protein, partial [Aurantimonas coralicida]